MDDLHPEGTRRQQLAEARIGLRLAQDVYDLVKAQAAQRITEAVGGAKHMGSNAEERDRALSIALAADEECMIAHGTVRDYQAQVDRLQARVTTKSTTAATPSVPAATALQPRWKLSACTPTSAAA